MKSLALSLLLMLAAGCTVPAERVQVAPAVAVVGTAAPTATGANPLVGGVELPLGNSIGTDLPLAPTLAALARAVAAAGQTEVLTAPAPITLFAPTDEAFGRLAPGTIEALLRPENRPALNKLIRLHLVAGQLSSAELVRRIAADGGHATLLSLAGEPLALSLTGSVVTLTDGGGNKSYVEVADVRASNGVMHVVNGVLVPRLP